MIHVRLSSVHILSAILDKTTFKHWQNTTAVRNKREQKRSEIKTKLKTSWEQLDQQNAAASVLLMISLQDLQVRLSLCLINRVEDGRSRMLKEVEDYLLSLVCV